MKAQAKRLLVSSGVPQALSRLRPPSVVVLRYHSVMDRPVDHKSYAGEIVHATRAFKQQMDYVSRSCVPISIGELNAMADHTRALPRRAVVVTFDDGYADNLHIAAPILTEFDVQAIVYVTVAWAVNKQVPWFFRLRSAFSRTSAPRWRRDTGADAPDLDLHDPAQRYQAFLSASAGCAKVSGEAQQQVLQEIERQLQVEPLAAPPIAALSPCEIRSLTSLGQQVGSHTMTHPNIAHLGEATLRWELTESKRILEEILAAPVEHFSYPMPILIPHHTDRTRQALTEAGYRTAVTSDRGVFREGNDPLTIARIVAPHGVDEFRWVIENAFLGRTP